jgi:hypothetical protein
MKFLKIYFLFAFSMMLSPILAQDCFDASMGAAIISPASNLLLNDPVTITVNFCNDEQEVPLDNLGPLKVLISDSKMDPNGSPTMPFYFSAEYVLGTWIFTQTSDIPAGDCSLIEIPYIVTQISSEEQQGVGINVNIVPSAHITGSADCFSFLDDNAMVFTSADASVPVDLLSFAAFKSGAKALLQWKTTNEINNSHFEIESSIDGRAFSFVGKLESDNSLEESNYSYTVENPADGVNYYRLKMVDLDGRYKNSEIRSLDFTDVIGKSYISFFPNPVTDKINIKGISEITSPRFLIYDVNGKLLMNRTTDGGTDLNLADLVSGVYTIKIIDKYNKTLANERITVMANNH